MKEHVQENMSKISSGGWIWKNWVSTDAEKEGDLIRAVRTMREEVGPLSSFHDREGVAQDVCGAPALVFLGQSE